MPRPSVTRRAPASASAAASASSAASAASAASAGEPLRVRAAEKVKTPVNPFRVQQRFDVLQRAVVRHRHRLCLCHRHRHCQSTPLFTLLACCALQLTVGCVVLMPLRLVALVVVLVLSALLCWLCARPPGAAARALARPIAGWRKRALDAVAPMIARLILACFGVFRVRVVGRPAERADAPIWVAAPHSSFLDPFIVLAVRRFSAVSRLENAKALLSRGV